MPSTNHVCTYLEGEEEGAIQGSDRGKVTVVFLGGERDRDVIPAPVHAGMCVAGRIHGEAIDHLGSRFPATRSTQPADAGWLSLYPYMVPQPNATFPHFELVSGGSMRTECVAAVYVRASEENTRTGSDAGTSTPPSPGLEDALHKHM